MVSRRLALALLFLATSLGAPPAQKYYAYVGALSADSVLLAWGTTDGDNTIGRSSPSHGEATVKIGGRTLTSSQNWMIVADLKPDTVYPYQISVAGRTIADSVVQTWAARDNKLVFFVIGDFGTGTRTQYSIAQAMWKEFERRNATGNPVRFILTTGDNIYGDISTFLLGVKNTGASDEDWAKKFFEPYKDLLLHVPFYATLGNHDGNETESHRDLPAFLDNFFFPGGNPARWYHFNYAGLADFFGLDTTMNTESGPPAAQYLENRPEFAWMQRVIPESKAPWKIPYFHHPPFSAGPRHAASYRDLRHWVELFARSGVKVSFAGHEHNFQVSQTTGEARGIRFIVSGAGGQLRKGDIRPKMQADNIAAFAQQNHFLVVEIQEKTMRITPLGFEPLEVRDASGREVPVPFTVTLP